MAIICLLGKMDMNSLCTPWISACDLTENGVEHLPYGWLKLGKFDVLGSTKHLQSFDLPVNAVAADRRRTKCMSTWVFVINGEWIGPQLSDASDCAKTGLKSREHFESPNFSYHTQKMSCPAEADWFATACCMRLYRTNDERERSRVQPWNASMI